MNLQQHRCQNTKLLVVTCSATRFQAFRGNFCIVWGWDLVFCRTEWMAADFDLIAENYLPDVFNKCSLVIWPICVVILYNIQLEFNQRSSEEYDASETLFQLAAIFSLESSRTSNFLLALGLRHNLPRTRM